MTALTEIQPRIDVGRSRMNIRRRSFLRLAFSSTAFFLSRIQLNAQSGSGNLTIRVDGARNAKGSIIIGMWKSMDGFPKARAKAVRQSSADIVDLSATVTFQQIPYGTYAVAVFHDENDNGKMDTKFLGIPVEGVGSSNNPHPRFSAPSFEQCKFELHAVKKSILIHLLY